jgi:hypothetical protein
VSAHDLPTLHRQYVALGGRFKAAWTFHQFLQGLQKFFASAGIPAYPTDLPEIHLTLKQASECLTTNRTENVAEQLTAAAHQLEQTISILAAADVRVAPPLLRQFFERVKSYDDQILAQMVRFYLGLAADDGLAGDRLDKVDFLLTKLSEETDAVTGEVGLRSPSRVRPIFEGFWSSLDGLTADADWIEDRKQELASFRRELAALTEIEAMTSSGIVARYREAKRVLGRYIFHPEIVLALVETNLAFKKKIQREFKAEEARILEESQRILTAEESFLGSATGSDLSALRRAYDEVERKQRADNLKLEDLAFLRREVEELRPRLLSPDRDAVAPRVDGPDVRAASELVTPFLVELVSALENTDNRTGPKEAALSRELFHLRLEAREVQAFRRLYVASEGGDAETERFVLEAAALRQRVLAEATEISGILDESMVTREAPIFEQARRTTRLAEEYVQRFAELADEAVRGGAFGEAQQMQLLRMRLLRDYAGLWLMVFRPTG